MNLEIIRTQIDEIDAEIVALICKRMNLAVSVANYKLQYNLPILNEKREQEVLLNVANHADSTYKSEAIALFTHLMELSKQLQENIIQSNL